MRVRTMNEKKRLRPTMGRRRRPATFPWVLTDHHQLIELAEAQAILLPELAARIAAVEHLLTEKKLCTHDELVKAREFIDLRRSP